MTGFSYSKKYNRKMISCLLFLGGAFLLIEHVYNFGGMDIELIGHEVIGIVMIAIGFLISIKWSQLKGLRKAIKERNLHAILDEGERHD